MVDNASRALLFALLSCSFMGNPQGWLGALRFPEPLDPSAVHTHMLRDHGLGPESGVHLQYQTIPKTSLSWCE